MTIRTTIITAALAALPAGAFAQDAQNIGEDLYTTHCAVCHGVGGEGVGAYAEFLTVAPPKLTDLAAQNDGEFPMLKIIHIIDGRSDLRAHGSEMPVWGDRFMTDLDEPTDTYYDVVRVRGLVLSLAQYLETIQK